MGFLALWLGTTAVSFGIVLSSVFNIFKEAADQGYSINSEAMTEIANETSDQQKLIFLGLLIPGLNILESLFFKAKVNNEMLDILDMYDMLGALEEMSPFEKAEYEKSPTGLNAIITPMDYKLRLKNAQTIIIDDYFTSEVVFEQGTEFEDITILKVSGPLARLEASEQKEIVNDARTKRLCDAFAKVLEIEVVPEDVDLRNFSNSETTKEFLKKVRDELIKKQEILPDSELDKGNQKRL